MWDLLRFHTFVTPWVLMGVYYMGALLMPLGIYYLFSRFRKRLEGGSAPSTKERAGGEASPDSASSSGRNFWSWKLRMAAVLAWFMGELAWRIFIEFFVAYFQMREALVGG